MNNEIIEFLLYKLEQNYKCEKEDYFILYKPDIKDLLDYITNLQQDNTMYAQLKDEYEEEIKELQQENEKLKELCGKYEEEHNTAFKLWTMKMEEMPTYEEKEDYKQRIDKAIEIIEKYNKDEGLTMYHDTWQHLYPVLKILKGDSDE